jgi:hypothetical protein
VSGSCIGEKVNAYRVLEEKPEGNLQYLKKVLRWILGWDFLGWIHLAPNRDQWQAAVNTVMNLRVP